MYNYKGKDYHIAPEGLKQEWVEFGNRMGYPPCCVDAFYNDTQVNDEVNNYYCGTGFTPCKDCAKLPTEDVVAYIDKHRLVATPFPYDCAEEEARLKKNFPIIIERVDAMRKGVYTHNPERLFY